ncbi:MAG: FAD/NAD(P)-binding protein [Propionibacteriaceae bacterium]
MGPRGAGLLERLISNAQAQDPGPMEIHLIDPYPAGAGRVWRDQQSPLLRLNSTAEDVTAFLDESVRGEGPVVSGPTLYEWAQDVRPGDLADPSLEAEAAALQPLEFASRRLASRYFGWAYERAVLRAPAGVELVSHRQRAVDLDETIDGLQRLHLEDGSVVAADAVVLLSSHVDMEPAEPFARLARFADDHDLTYLPPTYGGDVDLSSFGPGDDVIVRGFGLGFIDLMILLTEGRGGRFVPTDGGLSYLPSGQEPRLHVGSRRGVPYHCKPMYHLRAAKPAATKFLTLDRLARIKREHPTVEFRRDVWPVVAQEVEWAYYVELGTGHEGRLAVEWSDFERDFAALHWGTPEYHDYLRRAVPDPADRLDWTTLDRPLKGATPDQAGSWGPAVRAHVRADIDRRLDSHFSADLGAFHGFLAVLPVLGALLASPQLSPRSLMEEFFEWFMGLFNFYASGPPPDRLEQLLALERAGVMTFLGPGLTIRADDDRGLFVAQTSGAEPFAAGHLIDATLPAIVLDRVRDPLLKALHERGEVSSKVLVGPDGSSLDTGQLLVDSQHRIVDASGHPHERRFSLGMHTAVRSAAFARPGSNGLVHRHNDQVARQLLRLEPVRASAVPAEDVRSVA